MAGSHSAPQGLFVKSYKTDGKGYSSQYISAVESIKQAQNKNEDALTNRPYIGLYYEFYEALIALMFTEIGSVNAGSNTSFGIGVTCSEQPTASTFVGDQLYANSGFQITSLTARMFITMLRLIKPLPLMERARVTGG